MAVDSGKVLPTHHSPSYKPQDFKGHSQQQSKDMSKDIAIKSVREVVRKPKDITNKPRDITNMPRDITKKPRDITRDDTNLDIKYYPKKVNMSEISQYRGQFDGQQFHGHIQEQYQGQIENYNRLEMTNVTEYTSNDIQVTSHKLEPILLIRPAPNKQQDSIQVTSHKIPSKESHQSPKHSPQHTPQRPPKQPSQQPPQQPSQQQSLDSPSQRLLRRKQDVTEKPPEVYLLDLDEVKVHKVKRIFKIGKKPEDDTPRRCHSEERARRRTWHPTDTDRSTRSDGDVVTARAVMAADDFTSPLAQERSSRPRQRRSAFMESIHSFFGSRKSTSSPLKHAGSSPPKSPSSSTVSTMQESEDDNHHVARAVGGKYQGQQPQYNRVRHLAEENQSQSPQRPKSWDKSVMSPSADVNRLSVHHKTSSLPPNQQPPTEDVDDKNHVIYGMGEKTFKRFSKYLTVYDDPPESRV